MPDDVTVTTAGGDSYSSVVGLIYVFNLIVGTGALTMPKAFAGAGWLLSLFVIVILAFMSFLTVTFMIEVMAAGNAMKRKRRNSRALVNSQNDGESESTPLLSNEARNEFEILERIEMGQLASMFYNVWGVRLFYISIILYLYGDLAIYAAAMPKSLRDVVCRYNPHHSSQNCTESIDDSERCWESIYLTRMDVYRIFVAVFAVLLGPFVFFNVQKTKYLQLFTTLMRWFSFVSMVVLACLALSKHQGTGSPPVVQISGVPTLFGVSIYSFMCHHSLPSLVTPIANKAKLTALFAWDYLLILSFYCIIAMTAIFSSNHIQDLYTLNFRPPTCDAVVEGGSEHSLTNIVFFQYYISLFPVIVLSTNFPIIGITLRNNLRTLCLNDSHQPQTFVVDKLAFPLAALVIPFAIAMGTNHVDILVGITGSYAGAVVQYIVPVTLVYLARRHITEVFGTNSLNTHASPFKHTMWVIFVIVWAVLCVAFVTVNHVLSNV